MELFHARAICILFLMIIMMFCHTVVHILFNIEWFKTSNNSKWMFSHLLTWFITALLLTNFIEGS